MYLVRLDRVVFFIDLLIDLLIPLSILVRDVLAAGDQASVSYSVYGFMKELYRFFNCFSCRNGLSFCKILMHLLSF